MKLIQAGVFKVSDFLTSGALELIKLTAVCEDIAIWVESMEEQR